MTRAPVLHLAMVFDIAQRNEGAAEADQAGKAEQHAKVQAVGGQEAIDAEQAGGNAKHQHHGEVGGQEKHDTFHDGLHRNYRRRHLNAPHNTVKST